MNEFKTIPVSEYCPYFQGEHIINATFQKINFAGNTSDYAKCVECNCDSSHKCQQGNNCPVAIKAQKITQW